MKLGIIFNVKIRCLYCILLYFFKHYNNVKGVDTFVPNCEILMWIGRLFSSELLKIT